MIRLGYVEKFGKAAMPNATANIIDRLKSPPFDPKREFSMPWQSGMTGIIYRKDKVKREPTSVDDLFDPDYKGKVTFLTEMRDSVGLVTERGEAPIREKATLKRVVKAVDEIGEESDSGQIRGFTGNEYIKDITKGDSWWVGGWGDAVQLKADNPNIDFVLPESGGMLWTDDMQIPVGAPHAFTAEKLIDFSLRSRLRSQHPSTTGAGQRIRVCRGVGRGDRRVSWCSGDPGLTSGARPSREAWIRRRSASWTTHSSR